MVLCVEHASSWENDVSSPMHSLTFCSIMHFFWEGGGVVSTMLNRNAVAR
jgi:hypothetical protein